MRSKVMTAVLATASVTLLAQSAPIKMGLWEKTMVTSTGDGPPTTMKAKSCITPDEWQRMMGNIQKQHEGCKMNMVKNGNTYNFNGTCSGGGGPMTISGSETIRDAEHIVAESHSTFSRKGKTMKIDSQSTSQFLSANCGAVKPDDPEIE